MSGITGEIVGMESQRVRRRYEKVGHGRWLSLQHTSDELHGFEAHPRSGIGLVLDAGAVCYRPIHLRGKVV